MLQSCGIYQKFTHSARLRAYWFIHFPDFPQILYEVLQFPIKHNLHLMSIHELYDTLIWSKIHHLFTNRHIYQFCTQNRFTSIELIALIECALLTNTLYTFQRGQSFRSPAFFIKGKSEMLRFVLGCKVLIKVLFTTIMEQIGW